MPIDYGSNSVSTSGDIAANKLIVATPGSRATVPEPLRVVGEVVTGGEFNSSLHANSYNAIIGGAGNSIASGVIYSAILGSTSSSISSGRDYCCIIGGENSVINGGSRNFIAGGYSNTISAGAGNYNAILGNNCIIGSGTSRSVVIGEGSSVAGGYNNIVLGKVSQIAFSNSYNAILGGYMNNIITYGGERNVICGGTNNSIGSGVSFGTVVGGNFNATNSSYAFVCGGANNYANSTRSVIVGGHNNSTNSSYSSIVGGLQATTSRYGELAHSAGQFGEVGDAQHSIFILRGKTTSGSQTTTLGLNGTTTSRLTIGSGFILSGTINIIGSISTGANVARYLRQFSIKNVGGTVSLVGSIITLGTDEAAGTSISITADNTNKALQIQVTRSASETWRWVAIVDAVQIKYGT